jgi:hypothetical protein
MYQNLYLKNVAISKKILIESKNVDEMILAWK